MDVSIIIPVYNVAPYIEDCLRSVINQTYVGDIECILVDDCGTDDSIAKAEQMIAEYDGSILFEILHHETNRGLSAARNTGMQKATGEYILFVDSDDEIAEDCIEKMMAIALKDPAIELIQGSHITYCDGQQSWHPKRIRITHAYTKDEVRNCFYKYRQIDVVAWNKLMKRSVIDDNHLSFLEGLLYEDTPWTFYWLKYVTNAFFMFDITYHQNRRPQSIVTGTSAQTAVIHQLKGLDDCITHLTSGYEKQEIKYFIIRFSGLYFSHSMNMLELQEELGKYFHYVWRYHDFRLCFILITSSLFGRFRNGRIVYTIILRLMYPTQIYRDLVRMWRSIYNNNSYKHV